MDIRKTILNNLKGKSKDELKEIIQGAVNSRDEYIIPGLGVLFEAAWSKMNDEEKNNVLNLIMRGLE